MCDKPNCLHCTTIGGFTQESLRQERKFKELVEGCNNPSCASLRAELEGKDRRLALLEKEEELSFVIHKAFIKGMRESEAKSVVKIIHDAIISYLEGKEEGDGV